MKIIINLLKVAIIFINVWFVLSYIDVVIHNTNLNGGTILAAWNFFGLLMQKGKR